MAKKTTNKPAKAVTKVAKPKSKSVKPVAKSPLKNVKKEVVSVSKVAPSKPNNKPTSKAAKDGKLTAVTAAAASPQKSNEKPPKPTKEPKVPKVKAERKSKAKLAAEKTQVDDLKKWSDYKNKYGNEKAQAYSMSSTYEAGTPIMHKVLGWGFIIQVQNDRLEVLFETGSKVLISNYKP